MYGAMSLVDYGFYSDEEGHEDVCVESEKGSQSRCVGHSEDNGFSESNRGHTERCHGEKRCECSTANTPAQSRGLAGVTVPNDSGFSSTASVKIRRRPLPGMVHEHNPDVDVATNVNSDAENEPCSEPSFCGRYAACSEFSAGGGEAHLDHHCLSALGLAEDQMLKVSSTEPPKGLLETVERLQELKRRGITVNGNINTSLDFKNPYLLEKIMKVFDIDPYCSNYPTEIFDRHSVVPFHVANQRGPFYTFISKRQENRRHRREKQREVKESSTATGIAPRYAQFTDSHTALSSATTPTAQASVHGDLRGEGRSAHRTRRTRFESPPQSRSSEPVESIGHFSGVSVAVQHAGS